MIKKKELLYYGNDNAIDFLNNACNGLFDKLKCEIFLIGECVRDIYLKKKVNTFSFFVKEKKCIIMNLIESLSIKFIKAKESNKHLLLFLKINGDIIKLKFFFNRTLTNHDLQEVDFSVNALAYDVINKELVTIDNGIRDLEYGIIRGCNLPKQFIKRPILMLKAIRLSAQLGFVISNDTYDAIKKNAELISFCSKSTIKKEITQILYTSNPNVLELIVSTGLEKFIFNDSTPIQKILMCSHDNPWHYTDVFHHTMDVLRQLPNIFELKWAALFHDFGKPFVKTLKNAEKNIYRFPIHPQFSIVEAKKIMDLLMFGPKQQNLINMFIKYHDERLVEYDDVLFSQVVTEIGVNNFLTFIKLKKADANAHCVFTNSTCAINEINDTIIRFDKFINK